MESKYDPDEFFSAERNLAETSQEPRNNSAKLTNFEWLKTLSPERFALWLTFRIKFDNCTSFDEWLEWLQQEVDNGESN